MSDSPHGTIFMHLGFSPDGTPTEVGTVEDADDGEVVIHAMPMTDRFRTLMSSRERRHP